MANIKSAQKQAKSSEKKRVKNLNRKSDIKTATKKVLVSLDQGDVTTAQQLLKEAESKIRRAQGKNLLHKNTAIRKISRLAQRVAAAAKNK